MAYISDAQRNGLNKMCGLANAAALGTAFQQAQRDIDNIKLNIAKSGVYALVAADQTAGSVTIDIGSAVTGVIVQVQRSNNIIAGAAVTKTGNTFTVATNGSTYVATTGDVITYIAF